MQRIFVTTKEKLAYAGAAGGQVLSSSFLGLYVTYFFVSVFDIDARWVSTVLFIIGIWDSVNDLMMGALIDKTRTRFGKLKPYLVATPLPMMAAVIFLFSGPMLLGNEGSRSIKKVLFMLLVYFVVEWFMTMTDVPLWSFSSVISPNPAERSTIITMGRFATYIIGNVPVVAVPLFIDLCLAGKLGVPLKTVFFIMAVVFACVGMGLYFYGGLTVKERIADPEDHTPKIKESLRYLFANKYLLLLVCYQFVGAFANFSGIFTTYYYIDVLGSMSVSLLIGTPGTIISFLSYTYVPALQKKFSNKQLIIIGMLVYSVTEAILFFVGFGRADNMKLMIPALMIQGMIASTVIGIRSIIPTQMACDTIDYMEHKTGVRREGMTFSSLNFVNKVGANIARSIGLMFLAAIGYVTSNTDAHAVQSAFTKNGIWTMYTIVPYTISLLAIIPLLFYRLNAQKMKQINDELVVMRKERARINEKQEADANV